MYRAPGPADGDGLARLVELEGLSSASLYPRPLCVSACSTIGFRRAEISLTVRSASSSSAQIVPVDRADVLEPHLLPDHVGEKEPLDGGLDLARDPPRFLSEGELGEELLARFRELLVLGFNIEPVAPVREPADVLGDGPAVVVEDHDEALRLQVHDVVERFVARAGSERAVTDDCDDPPFLSAPWSAAAIPSA